MKEKLIIKNFGSIKSVDLKLGKITILIGEQASGKSTIAKVLAICRYFSYIIDVSNESVNYKSHFARTALRDWGLFGFEKADSYIYYENEDYILEIKSYRDQDFLGYDENNEPLYDDVPPLFKPSLKPKSDRFKGLMKELEELKPKREKNDFGIFSDWHIPHSFLKNSVKEVMNNPFYFPTERGLQSIFSLGKSSIQNLSDSLFDQFRLLDEIASSFKEETLIEPLNLKYKSEGGTGYFKNENQEGYLELSKGASGYKSMIPIVLVIKYYSLIEKRKRTFLIEEPEQNLFPKTQKELMDFLVSSVKKYNHSLLITTHSPYILTALENLMYADKLGSMEKGKYKEKVVSLIDEKFWINQKDVNVYSLEKGKEKDLMDRDEVLINKNYIDSISEIMNKSFDELLALEIAIENEYSL